MQPLPQANPIAIVAVAVSEAELEDDGTSVQLLPVASSVGAGSLDAALEGVPISNAVLESGTHSSAPLLDASLVTTTKAVLAVVEATPSIEARKATRPVAIAAAPAPAPVSAGVSAVIAEVVPSPVAAQKMVPTTMPTTTVAAVPTTTARVHGTNVVKHGGKQPRRTSVVEVVGDSCNSSAADKVVAALPQYIRDWYGEIVWTKRPDHPWWPGFVSDPRQLDPDSGIFDVAMSCIQTHFPIYYIEADDYVVVEHGSVRAWEEFMNTKFEETAAALPAPRRAKLESAVARAMIEIHKPKENRLWCQHYLYTKKVEERPQLRDQKPYWTVVSATESRIRLRLVVPSIQTSKQIVTEKPVVATVAPVATVAAAPIAIPTPPTPTPTPTRTPTAPLAPPPPPPVDNSRAAVVAKEDPFIAHATREIDTGEPSNKKAKKGTKLQKKSKRKQSKEERSVRPASEPLDAKENFGLYMFGLSHPGWQTLMCGFSLVPKCEGFEGYIREQKRYKQRSVACV